MEFILFIVGVVTFRYAWQAKASARQAHKLIDDLRKEMAGLRVDLASLRARTRQAPAPSAQAEADADSAAFLKQHSAANDGANADTVADLAAPPTVSTPPAQNASSASATPSAPPSAPPSTPAAASRQPQPAAPQTPRQPPSQPPQWLLAAKAWLFGGNLVAKLGLLILFIGISFLLKYTAARVSVPIEFRLAGIVLGDLALLVWGWRIRTRRPAISLPVQGTALAVLMLVTFGAFRLYHLIPGPLAFALLFVLTSFTCVLAALQNAQWLALFGIVGGFAAPILASTGGGSHIGLFSYYALLNAGVFGLALLRSWRALNLLGFAFTFAIGTAWGVLRYRPEDYLSAQLFLLLFFLYYVAIALAYARRQAVQLKNYVDGTLIFGTPMLAFGLQVGLVRQIEFGLAYSALALGLFYVGLAVALRRNRAKYALLGDTCLAIGVVFGTLTVPLALDGRWTSAAWALEGAGIVWVGLRQRQTLTWMFGLLVQAGAWLSFIGSVSGLAPATALESNLWLGFLLLAATAFLMATRFRAHANGAQDGDENAAPGRAFAPLAGLFLAAATVWLIAGAWSEIFLRTHATSQANLLVLSALLTAVGLGLIAKRMAWPLASWLALAAQALAGATLLSLMDSGWVNATPNLFDRPVLGALLICAGALFSSWALMRQAHADASRLAPLSNLLLLWSALWWFVQILAPLAGWLSTRYQLFNSGNHHPDAGLCWSFYMLLLAAGTAPIVLAARRLQWPALRWATLPTWVALAASTLAILVQLYPDNRLPGGEAWLAYAALWLAAEWLLRAWPANRWSIATPALQLLHAVRSAGPWLMIWPVAALNIAHWLRDGNNAEALLLADAGWHTDASWARFIPAWLMMAALAWLMQRGRAGGWPVAPLAAWYRRRLLPLACAWSVLLLAVWNLTQDGAMAPLPYLPLLNPLDLSSCFAMLLAVACYRMLREDEPAATNGAPSALAALRPRLLIGAALTAYVWFNLVLLRSVSHYADIDYAFDDLFASQFVQAMLSLVWSVTALILMRYAAKRASRPVWIAGAALLGLTVAKLFLVDLSNVGGVERIVSFLGVGALMVGIGYLAPYPSPAGQTTSQEAA
ncbi:DUF2339 domain-containing protein [Rugamonas sp. CCM 8940]|uniref:DUF2339 domain-containing protein n=1 Tax=Rugamonas sp. CCM 8940 TaxID=2765359 RepID=UPI0018F553D5|nr:DUF2339 domain-containing protein [Rugamonas sp. CCM 8940]MBJ7310299.1 DUF2339 domain-containing protein [Rugamonas sp. CCM 8940]